MRRDAVFLRVLATGAPSFPPSLAHRVVLVPHIPIPEHLPGIRGLLAFRPETGRSLSELADALLVGESPLSRGERETIAAYVSRRNECGFCTDSHAAAARHLLGDQRDTVDAVLADVATARAEGATDRDIHDTVLIAASFSMFNRYVDGLATLAPSDPAAYAEMGRRMAEGGYASRLDAIIASR